MRQFSQICQKMDAIKEGEGTLLDSMMFTYDSGLSSGMLHECSNLPTVIAGSAGCHGRLCQISFCDEAKS